MAHFSTSTAKSFLFIHLKVICCSQPRQLDLRHIHSQNFDVCCSPPRQLDLRQSNLQNFDLCVQNHDRRKHRGDLLIKKAKIIPIGNP